jgi:pilus assembly protein CpaB
MADAQGSAAASITQAEKPTVDILVMRSEVLYGRTVEAQHLTTIAWPEDRLPPGAITDLSLVLPEPGREPRRALARLLPGELLLEPKLSGFGEKVTLVQRLGADTRAMAIRVDATTAVGGFVTPGDFVDIVLTQNDGEGYSAVTIMQNIRVLGIDQSSEENSAAPAVARNITVEVTPDQSQRLALAQRAGTLSLSLRSMDAAEDQPLERVRLRDLMLEESPVPEGERKPQVTVRRGITEQTVDVNSISTN